MLTQQDIYAAGSKNHPPMINKENYVSWSSHLLCYAKSRPNGKLIYNSIMNGPYVRRMIPKPGDAARVWSLNNSLDRFPVPEMFHEQTDDELTEAEIKQMEDDDQAIQTILLGLPEDLYAAVDSCETAQEIWLRVQQMMKGSDIGIQEKKAKLFNEWERFTSTDGESIESYYHRFSKLMNDFKRNKHFPETIASNLKFLNNLQPEWSRHVTIVHQTNDLHTADYTQLYDFLKYNQKKVVQNAVQNPGAQNVRNQNGLIVVPRIANQNGNGNVVAPRAEGNANRNNGNQIRSYNRIGLGHLARNCIVRPRGGDVAYLQTQLLIAQKEEAGIQLHAEEFDLMDVVADLDEIEETDQLRYNFMTIVVMMRYLICLLKRSSIPQNDSNVISKVSSVKQGGGTVEQHSSTVKETHVYHESLFHNLAANVEKVNTVNRKMKETNAKLTTELARYKNQEKTFEISQEKYDKLERWGFVSQTAKSREELYLSNTSKMANVSKSISIPNKEFSDDTPPSVARKFLNEENEYAKLWNNWYKTCEECKYEKTSYGKAYNDMKQKIEQLQAQLGDQKGKNKDTPCVSDTLDPLPQKLENENVELVFQVQNYEKENAHLKTTYKNLFDSIKVTQAQTNSIIDSLQKQLYDTIYENAKLKAQLFDKVSEPKGTTKGTRTNTMFTKQSILGKPPSSFYKPKLYSVTPFPKSLVLPKVDKMNALSKLVTSNSAPSTQESKVVQTVNVIDPRLFRTNPSKTSTVDNVVPTKPTRRPHPRSNSNTDRVPSNSKSSCLSNNVEKIEENHRNSQIPKNQKHMSSECNNITLAIRNAKSKIVCVMCKQCLVTANHDVCVLNYVNGMNSHADNQSANVLIRENQKKHKANAKKSKELGSKGSLSSSRPSKPRTCLRWIPTGRIFAMCGKLTTSSNTENKSEKSVCDNASTSNPSEPSSKGFSNSASLLGRLSRLRK
ncbi:hypothetical protein Tco_0672201 [Tanacetum coccineum]